MAFKQAVSTGGTPDWAGECDGLPSLSVAGGSSRITRPLAIEEIPANLGDSIFSAGDTLEWFGPVPYSPIEAWLAIRLVEVLPQHPASFDEALPSIDAEIRASLGEIFLERWMERLETACGFEINESAMARLPVDPSEWGGL
jgi:hypothetical protein